MDNQEKKNSAADKKVQRLLSVGAHQLRSPIDTIQTQLKTLLAGYAGELPDTARRLIDGAFRKSEDMLSLLNDLMELSRMEGRDLKEQFEPVDLEEIVHSIIEHLAEKKAAKDLEFVFENPDPLPVVWAYRVGMYNIVHNLLENAIKYTPRGGRVRLTLGYDFGKGLFTGEVADTGIGISEEDINNVFTEFFRAANARQEEKAGTGLGLAIVAKSVRAHGGRINVRSTLGSGTVFEFDLPLVKHAAQEIDAVLKKEVRPRKKIVIIGGGAAGPKAAAKARRMDESADITIVEKGTLLSYAGCGLPYYISGMIDNLNDLMTTNEGDVRDPEFFRKIKDVNVLTRTEALAIDRDSRKVRLREIDTGREYDLAYDKLVLATGSRPLLPPIPGIDKEGVYTLQRMADAQGLRRELSTARAKDVIIIGGGLIAAESAEALTRRGARVTIIENRDQILSFLDPEIAALVKNYFENRGIRILLNSTVESIEGASRVCRVRANDEVILADLVIISVGVQPETSMAEAAGLEIGYAGTIKVSNHLETSDPDIYATGDCVANTSLITGKPIYLPLGSIANKHGRIAGLNVTGGREEFKGILQSVIMKTFNYNIAAVGLNERESRCEGFDPISVIVPGPDREHYFPDAKMIYLKLVADRSSRRLLGAQIVGRGDVSKRADVAATAIAARMEINDISKLDLAYAPPFSSAMDSIITAANVLLNKYHGNYRGITPLELSDRLKRKDELVILDVRTPAEYDRISIPGSILIPLNSLRGRLRHLPVGREIVICCRSGVNSYEAFRLLRANGFDKVSVLDGGIVTFYGEDGGSRLD